MPHKKEQYSHNRVYGLYVQGQIAKKYGVESLENGVFDMELEDSLIEVKSAAAWTVHFHRGRSRNRLYMKDGKLLVKMANHRKFREVAEDKRKQPFYCFVGRPRYVDEYLTIEMRERMWKEKLVNWVDANKMLFDTSRKRRTYTRWYGGPGRSIYIPELFPELKYTKEQQIKLNYLYQTGRMTYPPKKRDSVSVILTSKNS